MKRAVWFSAQAETDLESIGDAIAERNPLRAQIFVFELAQSCQSLDGMADRFQAVPRYPGVRRRVHGNYLIFYRTSPDSVEIPHILQGAMDYEGILFPEAENGS